jgi:hypothetical protein
MTACLSFQANPLQVCMLLENRKRISFSKILKLNHRLMIARGLSQCFSWAES